ncbi:MAG: flagellar hook protein FlgE [Chloroflexi bacterium]|nr:flagellar hook protein FlgE [Chloroflexota bacterium]
MLRSLLTAVSSLRSHQTYLDVVGNNIANVNTTGFKASRIAFQDLLSQTLRGGTAPDPAGVGGTNPMQVGMGMALRAVETIHTQGDLQPTGQDTDVAVEGEGFFTLSDGRRQLYTRDGSFNVGADGALTNAGGLRVQGWTADARGNVNTGLAVASITIPQTTIGGTQSTQLKISGNLDSAAAVAATAAVTMTLYDSLGIGHAVTVTFTKTAGNAWSWAAATTDETLGATGTPPTLALGTGALTFDATGGPTGENPSDPLPAAPSAFTPQFTVNPTNGAAVGQVVRVDMRPLSQVAQSSAVNIAANNGSAAGQLLSMTVDSLGRLIGAYSNGRTQALAQLAMARFLNPAGLNKAGGSAFAESLASGTPIVGTAGTGGRGTVASGVLEGSNVNLAEQFTRMILAERGFQANARVISTSDEVLQDLINLKR